MARAFKNWIEGFLDYTDNTEPPETYRKWVAISVIAAVLKRKCYLRWGDSLTFYPNMYIVLVGPPGKARKGTAMRNGEKLLSEIGIKTASESITREALIRELSECGETHTDSETGSIYIHHSLTVFSPELTVFLGFNNVALMSDLTDWFDCRDKWTYRTKGRGSDELKNLCLNMIGATTPGLVQSALPQDAVGSGLTSRMIFVYEEDKGKIIPTPFARPGDQEKWENLVNDLEKMASMAGEFRVTEGFHKMYEQWYIDQHTDPPFRDQNFAGYMDRRATHLMKLSMITSAATREDKILTPAIFEYALDSLETVEKKMPYTFSGFGLSKYSGVLSRMMQYITKYKSVTQAELYQHFIQDVDRGEDLLDLLSSMAKIGFCRQRITANGDTFIEYNEKYKPKR